ncbi:MAG: apolipoprotein N-acyltransferase [bacterium]
MNFKPYLLAILSGYLAVLSLPPYSLSLFAYLFLIPFLFSLQGQNLPQSFLLGSLQGLTFSLGLLFWIKIYHPLALLFLCLYLSLFSGVFGFLYSWIKKNISKLHLLSLPLSWTKKNISKLHFLIIPLLWVLIEDLRSSGTLGFPWGVIGYSQSKNTTLIQIADLVGVFGISFMVILVNSLLFEVMTKKLEKKYLLVIPLIFLFLTIYGKIRLREDFIPARNLKVSIIQANIDPDWYDSWNKHKNEVLNDLLQSSKKAVAEYHPDLIIWTETALHNLWELNPDIRNAVLNLAKEGNVNLLIGIPCVKSGKKGDQYFNSAFLISKKGEILGRYDKVHLVPFGEMIPFEDTFNKLKKLLPFLPSLRELLPMVGDFSPGKGFYPLSFYHQDYQIVKAGVSICFEDIFGYIAKDFINHQANFMVNITNDAWSKNVSAHLQHFEMAIFRAIEGRCFLVRAGNSGISALINPYGVVEKSLSVYQKGILHGEISTSAFKTFYSQYGDIFAHGCSLLTVILLISLKLSSSFSKILPKE